MKISNTSGVTLTELMITVAILGIITLPLTYFFANTNKGLVKTSVNLEAHEQLRQAFAHIEPVMMEANQIISANVSSMTFVADSNLSPLYLMNGDLDGDGISNIQDPDDDNDAVSSLLLPPTAQWRVGYDLKDDDDDNDGKKDVRVNIYKEEKKLYWAVSYNEAPWIPELLLDNVTTLNFLYFGSKREDLGRNIDRGNDGNAATNDAGENDGLITQREIDWVLPPTGHGNRSGSINTANELKYIVSIYLEVGFDKNGDGQEDGILRFEFSPPLLVLKQKV